MAGPHEALSVPSGSSGAATPVAKIELRLRSELETTTPLTAWRSTTLLIILVAVMLLHLVFLASPWLLDASKRGDRSAAGASDPRGALTALRRAVRAGRSKEETAALIEKALVEVFGDIDERPQAELDERERELRLLMEEVRFIRYAPQLGDYSEKIREVTDRAIGAVKQVGMKVAIRSWHRGVLACSALLLVTTVSHAGSADPQARFREANGLGPARATSRRGSRPTALSQPRATRAPRCTGTGAEAERARGGVGAALWALLRARELAPADAAIGREIEHLRQAANLDVAELAPEPLGDLTRNVLRLHIPLVALLLLPPCWSFTGWPGHGASRVGRCLAHGARPRWGALRLP